MRLLRRLPPLNGARTVPGYLTIIQIYFRIWNDGIDCARVFLNRNLMAGLPHLPTFFLCAFSVRGDAKANVRHSRSNA
jgi:hypothetical protein